MSKVKYWSSSPLVVPPDAAFHRGIGGKRQHLVMVSVDDRTAQVAKCVSAVVAQRIAEMLDKEEGTK